MNRAFAVGVFAGVGGSLLISAAASLALPAPAPPAPLRPIEIILHRFDRRPGSDAAFGAWMEMLHRRHREAVATLPRERTYFEAMFTAADEPDRLYWLTVQGAGGHPVESSPLDLDRRHLRFMQDVLVPGTHARLATRNSLAPDFVVAAIRAEQRREL